MNEDEWVEARAGANQEIKTLRAGNAELRRELAKCRSAPMKVEDEDHLSPIAKALKAQLDDALENLEKAKQAEEFLRKRGEDLCKRLSEGNLILDFLKDWILPGHS